MGCTIMIEENEKITKKEGYLKMNKKSLLMMMVTICLIAVVGVGATLAYLTDSTETLINTFTLGKTDIDIDEPDWEEPEDIVPGQEIAKDPTVTVMAKSVDSYVFMSVSGIDAMEAAGFEVGEFNAAWVKADDAEGKDGIYVYSDANGPAVVAKSDEDQELPALFEKVTYKAENTETKGGEFNLLVKAAAVQATGEEGYTYEDAYAAVAESLAF